MRRLVFVICSLATLACGATCPTGFFKNGALLIGIPDSGLGEGPKSLKFAGKDAVKLGDLLKDHFQTFTIKDSEATTAAVSECLAKFAHFALDDGTMIVFISARGFSSTKLEGGFVLTSDAAIDKLPKNNVSIRNGLAIEELLSRIRNAKSAQKYLLLDLCRDPAETLGFNNLINNRVLESLGKVTPLILLASKDSKRSIELADLGAYASGLADTLRPGMKMEELFKLLTNKTTPSQTPSRPEPAPKDWLQACPLCVPPLKPIQKTRNHIPAPKVLLASLVPVSLFQDSGTDPDTEEAVRKEETAQRVFIRYGEGNHFPGDPLHECDAETFPLCSEQFDTAAKLFDQAADSREKIDKTEYDALINSLRERGRICRALAEPSNRRGERVPSILGNSGEFQFAESHNVLGIANLEQGNYADAEAQFRKAIEKAPHWAYPRHNLALAYVEHGRYSDAEKEYREAIRLTPVAGKVSDSKNPCFHGREVMVATRPYLYYNLGVLLQRLNRLADAQQQFCLAEASFYSQMDQFDKESARDDSDRAKLAKKRYAAAKVNMADVNNSLGVVFESRNKSDKAKEEFGKALSNAPNLFAAKFNLAGVEAKKGPAKARQHYQEVIDGLSGEGSKDFLYQAAIKAISQLGAAPKK